MGLPEDRQALLEPFLGELERQGIAQEVKSVLAGSDNIDLPEEGLREVEGTAEEISGEPAAINKSLHAQIAGFSIPQKIKLALLGNQSARVILLRDSNRMIPFFVLQNPKLTSGEICEIARNTNLDSNILREVARNSAWLKDYQVKAALVVNPKVPLDVSLPLVKFLKDRELKRLARSKAVPQVLATRCARLLSTRESK